MRPTPLVAHFLLITALIGGCLGRLPLTQRELARLSDDRAPEPRERKSAYCKALDQWIHYLEPILDSPKRSLPMERDLSTLGHLLEPSIKNALQHLFNKANIKTFNGPLASFSVLLTGTSKRLKECYYCADHLIGTVLQEFLVGHAPCPVIHMNERQFTKRLAELMDQVARSIGETILLGKVPTPLKFDEFWDIIYRALDANWDGKEDFGNLLTDENMLHLSKVLKKSYVRTAMTTEGRKIYREIFQCPYHFKEQRLVPRPGA